jgi:Leucine-rich repeat (LRR) protein
MLPCEMQAMSWLKVLKVSKNKLKNLIFGVREMHELQILDLQNNRLKFLPSGLH